MRDPRAHNVQRSLAMNRVVLGIVDNPKQADLTVRRLVAAGFPAADVSVLFPDRHGDHDFAFEARTRAPEGALIGVAFGALLGVMTGLAVGLSGMIPSLAALAEAGPILVALSGAALGAALLGILGALVGLGSPAIEAKYYDGKVLFGTILIGIHTRTRDEQARARAVLVTTAASNVTASAEAALPANS